MNNVKKCNTYLKYLLVVGLFAFMACENKDVSTIQGRIEGIESATEISLYRQDFEKIALHSTRRIVPGKSSFRIKVGELKEPTFFQLHINQEKGEIITLLLEPKDRATLDITLNGAMRYRVEGSEQSLLTQQLTERIAQTKKSLDSLRTLNTTTLSANQKQEIFESTLRVIEDQRAFSTEFIRENHTSRAAVMALYQQYAPNQYVFDRDEDIRLFKAVANYSVFHFPESAYTEGLLRDIKNMERIVSSHRLRNLMQVAESTLPEIALPNPMGDTIRLSSLRGKVILLDFWASFNSNSLLENRELLDVYNKYRSKGFEIYQVSLDVKREDWVSAIGAANLPWINVSQLTATPQVIGLYNITQIPSNYLISKDFEIVGKNLYGKELANQLVKML